jgi:hypothetical protein
MNAFRIRSRRFVMVPAPSFFTFASQDVRMFWFALRTAAAEASRKQRLL